jgi:hypothetical protein
MERMAHGRLVYAGVLYGDHCCGHHLADFQTPTITSTNVSGA